MKKPKSEIITFKVDQALVQAMRQIPNRSEFIRAAILAAMDSVCPLCNGTGILTPKQKEHWREFSRDHRLQECDHCHEVRIVCAHDDLRPSRKPRARRVRSQE